MPLDSKSFAAEAAKFKTAVATSGAKIAKLNTAYKDALAAHTDAAKNIKQIAADVAMWAASIQSNIDYLKDLSERAKKVTGDVEMISRRGYDDLKGFEEIAAEYMALEKQLKKDKDNKDLAKKCEIAEKAMQKASGNKAKNEKDWTTVEMAVAYLSDSTEKSNLAEVESLEKSLIELTKAVKDGPRISSLMKRLQNG